MFIAPGTNLPRGYLTAGAGVMLHRLKNLDVSVSYDTVINTTHASAQRGGPPGICSELDWMACEAR